MSSKIRAGVISGLVLVLLVGSRPASAMQIPLFDRMAAQDQHEYVKYLVAKAEQVLVERNQPDEAAKLEKLFSGTPPGEHVSAGEKQFQENLVFLRGVLAEPPTMVAPPTVESALVLTMSKNKVKMWGNFSGALADRLRQEPFWPKSPLRAN